MPAIIRYRFGNPAPEGASAREVVAEFPLTALRSARCSAVTLLSYWVKDDLRDQLLRCLAVEGGEAVFEFQVPVKCRACGDKPRHRGLPSHTDLMLLSPGKALAIEAKYREDLYEDVARWSKRGSDPKNRDTVLEHWLHLIAARTGGTVKCEEVGDLVYQMVHRTASACWAASLSNSRPSVVHLLFGNGEHRQAYLRALKLVASRLDPHGAIDFMVAEVKATETARCKDLYAAYQRDEAGVAERVVEGVLDGSLYDFGAPSLLRLEAGDWRRGDWEVSA